MRVVPLPAESRSLACDRRSDRTRAIPVLTIEKKVYKLPLRQKFMKNVFPTTRERIGMKKPKKRGFCAIVLFFAIFPSSVFFETNAFGQQDEAAKGPPPVPVQVATVERKVVSSMIELVGTVEPVTESTVASEVSGVVESFPTDEGDYVEKGQLLARLGDRRLQLDLKGAVAVREKIKFNLAEARKELDRMEKLKLAESVAERSYDEAYFRFEALKQDLAKSEADIERLQYEIARKKVTAPFSGYIVEEHTQLGEWVDMGGAVVDLMDIGRVKAVVDVPERYFVSLAQGDKVTVVVGSLSRTPCEGIVEALLSKGDPNARTFPVKISLENPDMKIKSGMEAKVSLSVGGTRESLVMPKDAVVISGKDRIAYVVKDGIAQPVNIVIHGYFQNFVSFEGDLNEGDAVVVRGNERLRPGQAVRVVQS